MADTQFTVLNSTGATVTFRAQDIGLGTAVLVMMSVPSNSLGTALLGQAVMASSLPVAIASNQSAVPVSGTVTAVVSNTILTTNLTQFGGAAVSLGQAVMATSIPVAIASNQSAIPVSGTVTAVVNNPITAVVSGTVTAIVNNPVTTVISNVFLSVAAATVPTLLTVISTAGVPAAVAIKATSGTLKAVSGYNNNTSIPIFLKLYNATSGAVTVGSTLPKFTIGFAPGAPFMANLGDGAAFTTGMAYAITGLVPDTDTTTVGIDDLHGIITFI